VELVELAELVAGLADLFPVPAAIFQCIVPPLGALKSQLGGTYILSLLTYTVIVFCDYTSIYLYVYIHCVI
jgi:hypothetical protein